MIKTIGAVMLTAGLPLEIAKTDEHAAAIAEATPPVGATTPPITYVFFSTEEAAFIEAAVSRLIPADEQWPGALEAAVPNYIDKQLAGAWGRGERLYRSGPWQQGTPSQGYQLPFTPAELFHTALVAINKELAKAGTPFATMSANQQDAYLRSLEACDKDLDGVPSGLFFGELWEFTVEGFFSDPVYGGNRDMVAWRMIGFPGAYASYYDLVDRHGITIDRPRCSWTRALTSRNHWRGVVAVVDDGGWLILLERMDHAAMTASVELAAGKARAAALFKKPSQELEEAINRGRYAAITARGFVEMQGALPVVIDGEVVGAIGASFETPDHDVQVARAGLAALAQ